jgi:hypothetical protein
MCHLYKLDPAAKSVRSPSRGPRVRHQLELDIIRKIDIESGIDNQIELDIIWKNRLDHHKSRKGLVHK